LLSSRPLLCILMYIITNNIVCYIRWKDKTIIVSAQLLSTWNINCLILAIVCVRTPKKNHRVLMRTRVVECIRFYHCEYNIHECTKIYLRILYWAIRCDVLNRYVVYCWLEIQITFLNRWSSEKKNRSYWCTLIHFQSRTILF